MAVTLRCIVNLRATTDVCPDVGSLHPGGVAGLKGKAVRHLKVVRELGLERRETVRSYNTQVVALGGSMILSNYLKL